MWDSTPIMIAIQYGKIDIANYFLEQKDIQINHENENKVTALLLACTGEYNFFLRNE